MCHLMKYEGLGNEYNYFGDCKYFGMIMQPLQTVIKYEVTSVLATAFGCFPSYFLTTYFLICLTSFKNKFECALSRLLAFSRLVSYRILCINLIL